MAVLNLLIIDRGGCKNSDGDDLDFEDEDSFNSALQLCLSN